KRKQSFVYDSQSFYDEMFDSYGGVRSHYQSIHSQFAQMSPANQAARSKALQQRMIEEGITFTLYRPNQSEPLERTIPFDYIPRVIAAKEWDVVDRGLRQRVQALNAFIHDIYHNQNIIKDGVIPRRLIVSNTYYRPEMVSLD